MSKQRPLRFVELEGGCFVVLSHALDHNGYFSRAIGAGKKREWFHRTIWRARKGDIPPGFEIDHLCGNPACCNVEHLQCIPGAVHARESGKLHGAGLRERIARWWSENGPVSGKVLSHAVSVSHSTACLWIRQNVTV